MTKRNGRGRSVVVGDSGDALTETRVTFRLARVERDQLDAYAIREEISMSEVVVQKLYETGVIELLDFVVVEDGGTLVNPMIVDGQIHGGTAQGIGTCLYEEMPFDAQGQPLASTMLDYLLPGATEVPDIRVLHMESPSPYTEFGIKGLGEGGAVGPPAAIISAVNDALRPLGVEVHDLPLTPASVLTAIAQSRGETKAAVQ